MTVPQSPPPGWPQGPGAYGPPPAPYGTAAGSPGPPATGGWPGRPPQTEPKALVALVLAVLAYTPLVPFVGAVAAIVLARHARRDIAASDGGLTGEGLARVASVLSWVHLGLLLLLVPVLLLFLLPVLLPVLRA